MNELHVLVVGLPALVTILLILGRAVTRSVVELPRASAFARLSKHENLFDWVAHIAFGSTVLAVLTVLGLSAVDRPHPAVGIFTGIIAALIAYAVLRPPVRPDTQNPEFDGPLILASTAIHVGLGILLAGGLIYGTEI